MKRIVRFPSSFFKFEFNPLIVLSLTLNSVSRFLPFLSFVSPLHLSLRMNGSEQAQNEQAQNLPAGSAVLQSAVQPSAPPSSEGRLIALESQMSQIHSLLLDMASQQPRVVRPLPEAQGLPVFHPSSGAVAQNASWPSGAPLQVQRDPLQPPLSGGAQVPASSSSMLASSLPAGILPLPSVVPMANPMAAPYPRQHEAIGVSNEARALLNSVAQHIRVADPPEAVRAPAPHSKFDSTFASFPALMPSQSGLIGPDQEAVVKQAVSAAAVRSRHPFKTIEELQQVLTEVAELATDTESMKQRFKYMQTVVDYAHQADLYAAQDYHFFVAREEQRGTHVINSPKGYLNAEAYQKFIAPVLYARGSGQNNSKVGRGSGSARKRQRGATPSDNNGGPPLKVAKGSCIHHPDSTTHTTDSCRRTAGKPRVEH